ncbi:virginiamycin B lyase family protein [Fictibacillus sp. S7]|uniref:virginiamycin B lyase family protein n=1 Tax=Fictibacillus sp. S7 TaxID=2212476 RepID=UPI003CD0DA8C
MWFTQHKANFISSINKEGTITSHPVPTLQAGVMGITTASNGSIGFTENQANKIAVFTPDQGLKEYNVPTPESAPFGHDVVKSLCGRDCI